MDWNMDTLVTSLVYTFEAVQLNALDLLGSQKRVLGS
jgi:hypothetical protein